MVGFVFALNEVLYSDWKRGFKIGKDYKTDKIVSTLIRLCLNTTLVHKP